MDSEDNELPDTTSLDSYIHKQSPKQDATFSWVLCSIGFLLFFCGGGFLSSVGTFIHSMATGPPSLSTTYLSVMFSSIFGFILMFGLPSGLLVDFFGYRKTMAIGGALVFSGLFTTAWCTKVWQMIFTFSVTVGLGFSMTAIPVLSLINQYFREYQTIACGLVISGWGIGTLVFGALNDWMLSFFDWSFIFIVASILIGGGILAASIVCERRSSPDTQNVTKILKPYIQSWLFRKLFLGSFFIGIGVLLPWLHLIPYAESINIPRSNMKQQALYIVASLGLANGVGRIILGYLANKNPWFRPIRVLRISFAVIGFSTPIWYLCDELWSLIIYSSLYGFFAGSLISLLPPMLAVYFPNELCFGTIIGMMSTATGIGTALSIGVSVCLVYYAGNFFVMILLSSAFVILGFVVFCTVPATVPFWIQEDFESDGIETIFTKHIWEKSS